ncbi:MAG: hypothetical protein WD851_24950 [Pirellulales bacterium]
MRTNPETTELGPANSVAEFDDPTATTIQPLSLRLIAYVFLFIGTLGLFDLFRAWFHDNDVYVSFNAALLLVGWGLFYQKPLAREFALFIVWLCIFSAVLTLGIVWLFSGEALRFNIGRHSLEPTFAIRLSYFLGSFAVLVVLWRVRGVLSSEQTVRMFAESRNMRPSPISHPWLRFSVGNLLFAMAVVAFIAAQIGMDVKLHHSTSSSMNSKGSVVLLEVGTFARVFMPNHEPELAYLVIVHGSPGANSLVSHSLNSPRARLRIAGQEPIVLPSNTQLFEWRDGRLDRSDMKITYAEFEKVEPNLYGQWSLEKLEEEVARLRATSTINE